MILTETLPAYTEIVKKTLNESISNFHMQEAS